MRAKIFILLFFTASTFLIGQTEKKADADTLIYHIRDCRDCPSGIDTIVDTIIYKLLRCGLYKGSNGDIAFRTFECYNENCDKRIRFVNWIRGVVEDDTVNGGLKEMKFVIDTSTFEFLNLYFWADKNHIYGYTPMEDGGSIYLHPCTSRKTFTVFGLDGYAKDKTNVYFRSSVVRNADRRSFRIIENKEYYDMAYDKFYFYLGGGRIKLTEKEIKELHLENVKCRNSSID